MTSLYQTLLGIFQIIFLVGSAVFVVAFLLSATEAGRVKREETFTARTERFLNAIQSIAVAIALVFAFWAANTGVGIIARSLQLAIEWQLIILVVTMLLWIACAFRLAWSWRKLQRTIRRTPG